MRRETDVQNAVGAGQNERDRDAGKPRITIIVSPEFRFFFVIFLHHIRINKSFIWLPSGGGRVRYFRCVSRYGIFSEWSWWVNETENQYELFDSTVILQWKKKVFRCDEWLLFNYLSLELLIVDGFAIFWTELGLFRPATSLVNVRRLNWSENYDLTYFMFRESVITLAGGAKYWNISRAYFFEI